MKETSRAWRNVGQTERWLSMVAGGALAAYGLLRKRNTSGGAAALAGAALLYRGATGYCPVYGAAGISTAEDDHGHAAIADRAAFSWRSP